MSLSLKILVSVFILSSGYNSFFRLILGQSVLDQFVSSFTTRMKCPIHPTNFTNYMFFSRAHPTEHQFLLPFNKELLQQSDFDPNIPTKVIVHGYTDSVHVTKWMQSFRDALFALGAYNVIIVDWSCGNAPPYVEAIRKSKIVGNELANLIKFLMESTGASASSFHLIGHSLGCHLTAVAGHALYPRIGRITGLDPAGPLFYEARSEDRLDTFDAEFVDIIHTDAGTTLIEGMGMLDAVGDVDFYPNGGRSQPGCQESLFSIQKSIKDFEEGNSAIHCDHIRAVYLYIESIKPLSAKKNLCAPMGVVCRDWKTYEQGRCGDCSHPGDCGVMGFHSDLFFGKRQENVKKEFFLKTSGKEPYCLYQYVVVVETACDFGSCNEGRPRFEIKPGVMQMEVQDGSGNILRLVLDDSSKHSMKPGSKYEYLVTSEIPLANVQNGKVWWGTMPREEASSSPSTRGLQVKSIQINPISAVHNGESYFQPQMIVLCGPRNRTMGRNQFLELSPDIC